MNIDTTKHYPIIIFNEKDGFRVLPAVMTNDGRISTVGRMGNVYTGTYGITDLQADFAEFVANPDGHKWSPPQQVKLANPFANIKVSGVPAQAPATNNVAPPPAT